MAWFYRALRNAVVDDYRRNGARSRALAAFAEEVEASEAPDAELASVVCQCVARLADPNVAQAEHGDAYVRERDRSHVPPS